jgi:hypothetical protein
LLEGATIAGTGVLIGTGSAAILLEDVSGLDMIAVHQGGYASISSVIGVSHINVVQGNFEANVIDAASGGTGITLSGTSQLEVPGSVGAGVTIAMKATDNVLSLGRSGATRLNFAGTLSGFNSSDAILIDGVPVTSVTYTAGSLGAPGMLDLFANGEQDGSIAITGTFTGKTFLAVGLGNNETEIVLSPPANHSAPGPGTKTPDNYLWIGPISGNWQTASNWEDLTSGADPATIAPGSLDNVTFDSSTSLDQVINGNGKAASLTLNGNNLITGTITASTLAGTGTLGVVSGGRLLAVTGALAGGFDVQGTGALAKVSGNLTWGYGAMSAAAGGEINIGGTLTDSANDTYLDAQSGGTILAGALVMTGNNSSAYYVSVASSAVFQIGTGAAVTGELVVEAGATFSQNDGSTYLQSNVLDDGTISVNSLLEGATIAGTGVLIGTGSAAILLEDASGLGMIAINQGGYASISSVIGVSHINVVQGSFEANVIDAASGGTGITLSGTSNLDVSGRVGAGVTVDMLGANEILSLGSSGTTTLNFAGTLSGFSSGDVILIDGVPVTSVTYTAGGLGAPGMLDLFANGEQDGSIAITGTFTGETFVPATLGNGETEIVLSAAAPNVLAYDNASFVNHALSSADGSLPTLSDCVKPDRSDTEVFDLRVVNNPAKIRSNGMVFIHSVQNVNNVSTMGGITYDDKTRELGLYNLFSPDAAISQFELRNALNPKSYGFGSITSVRTMSQLQPMENRRSSGLELGGDYATQTLPLSGNSVGTLLLHFRAHS